MYHPHLRLSAGLIGVAALSLLPVTAAMGAPPMAATAYATAVVGPVGGSVSGFGITATFAPGAVGESSLVILTNWPNGLDVTPPSGQAVKTFGLQICADTTGTPATCTSEFGNYPNSPSGTERINGTMLSFSDYAQSGVNFGTASNKLVTITVRTGGQTVYVYNPNLTGSAAYPKLLPSAASGGVLTFQTFQPIVWTVTSPLR